MMTAAATAPNQSQRKRMSHGYGDYFSRHERAKIAPLVWHPVFACIRIVQLSFLHYTPVSASLVSATTASKVINRGCHASASFRPEREIFPLRGELRGSPSEGFLALLRNDRLRDHARRVAPWNHTSGQ